MRTVALRWALAVVIAAGGITTATTIALLRRAFFVPLLIPLPKSTTCEGEDMQYFTEPSNSDICPTSRMLSFALLVYFQLCL